MWIQDPTEGIDNVEIELRWHDEGADEEYWDALIAEWEETAHQEYLDEYGDDELE